MKKVAFLLLAGTALLGVTGASAQTATVTASVTIPEVLSISVDANTVTFDQPAAEDYDAVSGAVTIGGNQTTTIATRGNVIHYIEVQPSTATFGFVASGGDVDPNKPAGDLAWSTDGITWTGMNATTPGDVASNLGRGVNAAAATVQYQLQSTLAGDPPGDYSLTFVYTVFAN